MWLKPLLVRKSSSMAPALSVPYAAVLGLEKVGEQSVGAQQPLAGQPDVVAVDLHMAIIDVLTPLV